MTFPLVEQWPEIERLLDQALDLGPEAQAEFLHRIYAQDPELGAEVERLLRAITTAEDLLQDTAPGFAAPLIAQVFKQNDLAPGTRLGGYEIISELGRGGTAMVYLAQDRKHGRRVAVKVPHPELGSLLGPERFLREIQIAAQLQHPNILPLHDSGEADGVLYYVMPYVEGESLRQRLERESTVSLEDSLHIARQVGDALGCAHDHGVVHRDIKPENILLSGGHALVADFGIARAMDVLGDERLTQTGLATGTPAYMSPEQAAGNPVDGRTDVYALGCVMYEMLAGEPPYSGDSVDAISRRRLSEPIPSVAAVRDGVPGQVEQAIRRALAPAPADRFTTAREFVQALDAPVDQRTPSRSARAIIGTAAAMVMLTATGAVLLRREHTSPSLTLGQIRQITNAPGLELDPQLSPDGTQLAYAAGPLLETKIYVRPLAGGRAMNMTEALAGGHRWPQWSPDGTRLLFVTMLADTQFVDVIPGRGGPARHLVRIVNHEILSAAWSPDGKSIAYAPPRSVVVQRLDGSPPDTLAKADDPNSVSWSPDGSRIAYVESNGAFTVGEGFGSMAASDIRVVPVTGGPSVAITSDNFQSVSPVWSRDGKSLLFLSNREGQRDLYRVRVGRSGAPIGQPERITTGLSAHSISVGPDGRTLLYSAVTLQSNVWSIRIPQRGSVSVAEAEPVTEGNQVVETINVSSDGKWLAFDSNQNGPSDIYRMRLPDGEIERMTDDPADDFAPAWSPDGREIAFHSFRNGTRDIFVMPAIAGAPAQVVTSGPAHDRFPHWSPDGLSIAFERDSSPNTMYLVKREASGSWGKPRRLGALGPDFAATWSPDGRHIFAAVRRSIEDVSMLEGHIRVIYRPRDLNTDPSPAGVRLIDNGRTIVFKAGDKMGFWSIPVSGGTPRQLVRFDVPGRDSFRADFDVSRGRLYFVMANHQSDLYMAELR
jgi:eukaryotic-like serine/threonine-protein kinase